jgi:hypothetical protein
LLSRTLETEITAEYWSADTLNRLLEESGDNRMTDLEVSIEGRRLLFRLNLVAPSLRLESWCLLFADYCAHRRDRQGFGRAGVFPGFSPLRTCVV